MIFPRTLFFVRYYYITSKEMKTALFLSYRQHHLFPIFVLLYMFLIFMSFLSLSSENPFYHLLFIYFSSYPFPFLISLTKHPTISFLSLHSYKREQIMHTFDYSTGLVHHNKQITALASKHL